ncbi:MAG: helix-turn-helix domain-containing protein [Pirellula sp.]|jgi:excisionase family DNA binding protein
MTSSSHSNRATRKHSSNKKVVLRPPELQDDSCLAYTIRQAAYALNLSERTIYSLIKSGDLRAVKIRHSVRIPRESLLDLLQGREK